MSGATELTGDRRIGLAGFVSLEDAYLTLSTNPTKGEASLCFGDSGGPAFVDAGGGEYFVATISIAVGNLCKVGLALDNRIDTPSAQRFILAAIKAAS